MRDPVRITGLLANLASDLGIEHPFEGARLFSSWESIVGTDVAAKCRPTALRNGVLKVGTSSAAWASECRYLAPEMIKRINAELGKEVVKEVKPWVEAPPGGPR